jgi:hypothetical protein
MHPTFVLTDTTAGAADNQAEGEGNIMHGPRVSWNSSNQFLTSVVSYFYHFQERNLLKDNKELRDKVNETNHLEPTQHRKLQRMQVKIPLNPLWSLLIPMV